MLGLNTLFESMKQTSSHQEKTDALFENFQETIDDDIKSAVTGDDFGLVGDDSVESDIAGNGIDEDDEDMMERLLDKIPPEDDSLDDKIEDIDGAFEAMLITEGAL